jgi:hypothetical protein
VKKRNCADEDFEMRKGFCEQTIRFWKKSKGKDAPEQASVNEDPKDGGPRETH